MFTFVAEGKKDYVERLRELDFKVLQLLVDYMYTSEITITKENVQVFMYLCIRRYLMYYTYMAI